MIQVNKAANTLTVRASTSVMQIIEQMIAQNDKPRAEIVIDVEILEVNRTPREAVRPQSVRVRDRRRLLAGGGAEQCRPRQTPGTGTGGDGGDRDDDRRVDAAERRLSPPPFNLNTITQGVSTADFYLAVPTALVRFLETDTQHEARRQAAAARRRRIEADAEAGRPDSGDLDQLHAARHRRRRRQPAELVHLPGRRREHRHDADG